MQVFNWMKKHIAKVGSGIARRIDWLADAMIVGIAGLDRPMSAGDKYTPSLMKGMDWFGGKLETGGGYIEGNKGFVKDLYHLEQLKDEITSLTLSKRGEYVDRQGKEMSGYAVSLDGYTPFGRTKEFPNIPVPMYRALARVVNEDLFIYKSLGETLYCADTKGNIKKAPRLFPVLGNGEKMPGIIEYVSALSKKGFQEVVSTNCKSRALSYDEPGSPINEQIPQSSTSVVLGTADKRAQAGITRYDDGRFDIDISYSDGRIYSGKYDKNGKPYNDAAKSIYKSLFG